MIAEFGIRGQPDMFNKGGPTIEVINGVNHQSNKITIYCWWFSSSGINAGIASAMALILGATIFIVSIII